jgi:hypothetical protein
MASNPAVKQYKALGDEVWKSKVDKIVSTAIPFFHWSERVILIQHRMLNFLH